MKSFLFVQWKKATDLSRFVIDGQVSEYTGSEVQNKLMRILAEVPKCREVYSNKKTNKLSPSFRCSYMKTQKRLLKFIEGNFEDTDCSGRQLVYIFGTFEDDSINIAKELKYYASLLGVTPYAEDLEEIKKKEFTNKLKIQCVVIVIVIVIVILVLLFILLNLQNKQ